MVLSKFLLYPMEFLRQAVADLKMEHAVQVVLKIRGAKLLKFRDQTFLNLAVSNPKSPHLCHVPAHEHG